MSSCICFNNYPTFVKVYMKQHIQAKQINRQIDVVYLFSFPSHFYLTTLLDELMLFLPVEKLKLLLIIISSLRVIRVLCDVNLHKTFWSSSLHNNCYYSFALNLFACLYFQSIVANIRCFCTRNAVYSALYYSQFAAFNWKYFKFLPFQWNQHRVTRETSI